jgi:hypothetical protein
MHADHWCFRAQSRESGRNASGNPKVFHLRTSKKTHFHAELYCIPYFHRCARWEVYTDSNAACIMALV